MGALKAVYDDKGSVPEGLGDYYVAKDDGRMFLNVEAVGGFSLTDVTNLQSALTKERDSRKKFEKTAKAFDGIEASDARDAIAKLADLGDLDGLNLDDKVAQRVKLKEDSLQKKYDEDRARVEAKAKTDGEGLLAKIARLQKSYAGEVIQNQALKALATHEASPELLLPVINSRTRFEIDDEGKHTVQVLDEQGNAMITRVTGESGDMGLGEFVGELKKIPAYAGAFPASPATGSGSPPNRKPSSGAPSDGLTISRAEIRLDFPKYKAMSEQAEKENKTITITED